MANKLITNCSNIVPAKETASTGLAIARRLAGRYMPKEIES